MDNSRFSKLPAELRNRIYEFVFHGEKTVDIIPSVSDFDSCKQHPATSRTLHIALTQTCRAIRQETNQMFYSSLSLSFHSISSRPYEKSNPPPFIVALRFLNNLAPCNAAAIRKIILTNGHGAVYRYVGEMEFDDLWTKIKRARKAIHASRQIPLECSVGFEVKFEWLCGLRGERLMVPFWFECPFYIQF